MATQSVLASDADTIAHTGTFTGAGINAITALCNYQETCGFLRAETQQHINVLTHQMDSIQSIADQPLLGPTIRGAAARRLAASQSDLNTMQGFAQSLRDWNHELQRELHIR